MLDIPSYKFMLILILILNHLTLILLFYQNEIKHTINLHMKIFWITVPYIYTSMVYA